MSKLLIALLALDIGVSLSKVFIFTWKSNYLIKKGKYFLTFLPMGNNLFNEFIMVCIEISDFEVF